MKLELLDTYHIRVRLSASIIVLAPVAITIFFLLSRNSYYRLFVYPYCRPSIAYELSSNCAEADLPKETSVQKLCSAIPHAK